MQPEGASRASEECLWCLSIHHGKLTAVNLKRHINFPVQQIECPAIPSGERFGASTRWTANVSFPLILGGNVTKCVLRKALRPGKLIFGERSVNHRVAGDSDAEAGREGSRAAPRPGGGGRR